MEYRYYHLSKDLRYNAADFPDQVNIGKGYHLGGLTTPYGLLSVGFRASTWGNYFIETSMGAGLFDIDFGMKFKAQ